MSDSLRFTGEFRLTPQVGNPSGDDTYDGLIDESLAIVNSANIKITMSSDAQVTVPFGTLTGARLIKIKVLGGTVQMALTSAAGTDQVIPVGSFAVLFSGDVPFTSCKLTRTAGVTTLVRLFLGE